MWAPEISSDLGAELDWLASAFLKDAAKVVLSTKACDASAGKGWGRV